MFYIPGNAVYTPWVEDQLWHYFKINWVLKTKHNY